MELYIVRHTLPNLARGTCYGHTDVPLSDSFVQEARAVLHQLRGTEFTHCFSSPLSRCRRLADFLAGHLSVASFMVREDPRLMELNFGAWEGQPWEQVSRTPQAQQWFDDFVQVRCPGGESYADLLARVRDFLQDFQSLPGNARVLIVTHGGPVRAFRVLIEGGDPRQIFAYKVRFGGLIRLSL